MRKNILKLSAVAFSLCLMLSSCGLEKNRDEELKNLAREECSKSFDSICSFSVGEIKGKLSLGKRENEHYSLVFLSPSSISNMKFEIEGDKIIIGYKGIEKEMDKSELFSSSVIKIISACLSSTEIGENINITSGKDCIEVTGATDDFNFKLLLNKDTMDMLSLSVPEEDLELKFENFNLI